MVQIDGKSEDQHYVPKMLLRGFLATPKRKDQVWVFDKHESRSFLTHIRNIATERNFYELENGSIKGRVEAIFSALEDKTSSVIEKIVAEQSLANLDMEQRGWLAIFITTQSLRTKHFREVIRALSDGYKERLEAMGFDPNDVEGFQPIETEDDLKIASIAQLIQLAKSHAALFEQKVAFLIRTTEDRPFWTSDHPVVMHNSHDRGPYGNIGISVPGIEIYFPLTSTLMLGLWCPQLADVILNNLEIASNLRNIISEQILLGSCTDYEATKNRYTECEDVIRRNKPMVEALSSGSVIESTAENVTFYNSQQVTWSHRFVISPINEFSLANKMISDNPDYREGLKPTFG